jgi:RimJ/RimL family protein N-acetyltransferase
VHCAEDPDPLTFGERIRPLIAAEPFLSNIIATVLDAPLADAASARWLRVHDGDELVGAAIWTPPRGVHLGPMIPPAAREMADHLVAGRTLPPSVNGPNRAALAFARRISVRTGRDVSPGGASRIYRLDRLTPPVGVPGGTRPATARDRELILGWLTAFDAEANPGGGADHRLAVDHRLGSGQTMWLWETAGEPVSFCWYTPVSRLSTVSRIGVVYTPPAVRGHGYASANVAAVSRLALDAGATACMLYTDLANPTSNRIYQAIGYRPIADAQEWRLS